MLAFVKRFPFLIIVGVLAVGGYLFHDFTSGNVSAIRVGDCFDLPTSTETVQDVQHHPCSSPHDAELIFTLKYDGSGAYPGTEVFSAAVKQPCPAAYLAYVGRNFDTDPVYNMTIFYPLADGWAKGDRSINCLVVREDGKKITGSVRAATK